MRRKSFDFDVVVIGSGAAGLFSAIKAAESGLSTAVLTKRKISDTNTSYAQGGIASVVGDNDSFESHVKDTLDAGDHLCKPDVVKKIVKAGPIVVRELEAYGLHFTKRNEVEIGENSSNYDLGKEGGHSVRRVLHSGDFTGEEIENTLIGACKKQKRIKIFENHIAVDLITSAKLGWIGEDFCLGVYVLDTRSGLVKTFISPVTIVACGGAGKVYLYSSNPDVATGDGIAMCYRAHVPIMNMEFFQFHPTILYHPIEKSFLISEALRGEGAKLLVRGKDGRYEEKSFALTFIDN
ncbi:MAG TPA: FAD-dependent oxidoreductase, partial [Victivallales bacterium]|nr:FAD-dependent oxidoreductase [Victivallales bacterium]